MQEIPDLEEEHVMELNKTRACVFFLVPYEEGCYKREAIVVYVNFCCWAEIKWVWDLRSAVLLSCSFAADMHVRM